MFSNVCALSKYLETVSENLLNLERHGTSKPWKIKETTLTDLIIAGFKASPSTPWIQVDASDEATTNADFEAIFRRSGKDLTFLIQAKRSEQTSNGTVIVPEIFHPQTKGTQNKNLIEYAEVNNMLPFYAVYLSSKSKAKMSVPPLFHASGIMLQDAWSIRQNGFRAVGSNNRKASKLLRAGFPFHDLFCLAAKKRSLEVLENHFLRRFDRKAKKTPSFITRKIDLVKRRARDDEQRQYRLIESASGWQTSRLLFDLDRLPQTPMEPPEN